MDPRTAGKKKRRRGAESKRKAASNAAVEAKRRKLDAETDPDTKIERKEIDLNTLDLQDKQYVDAWEAPTPKELPARQERWKYEGDGTMVDRKNLPKGWNSQEPDLDPSDVDAQIVRCQERIADKIMPFVFEGRLETLQKQKKARDKIKEGEPEGLPWDVYVRINQLKNMEVQFGKEKAADPFKQLPNVKALLAGYREGKLVWRKGLVTYWSKGKQLSQPRPFDWDEFEAINKAHTGDIGFWVEGHRGPGATPMFARMVIDVVGSGLNAGLHMYHIALRLPGYDWWEEFEFIADTGSASMLINDADLQALMGPTGPPHGSYVQTIGLSETIGAAGDSRNLAVIEVEACILNHQRRRMTSWHRIETVVSPQSPDGLITRLDGPVGRYLLYNAIQPDNLERLFLSNTKSGLELTAIDTSANPAWINPIILGNYLSYPVAESGGGLSEVPQYTKTLPGRDVDAPE